MDILSVVGERARFLQWKSLTLDLESRRAEVDCVALRASPAEFTMLQLLVSRRNVAMTKDAILLALFGADHGRDPRIVDVFVARLRTALGARGLHGIIETVCGRGYAVLDADGDEGDPAMPVTDNRIGALLALA